MDEPYDERVASGRSPLRTPTASPGRHAQSAPLGGCVATPFPGTRSLYAKQTKCLKLARLAVCPHKRRYGSDPAVGASGCARSGDGAQRAPPGDLGVQGTSATERIPGPLAPYSTPPTSSCGIELGVSSSKERPSVSKDGAVRPITVAGAGAVVVAERLRIVLAQGDRVSVNHSGLDGSRPGSSVGTGLLRFGCGFTVPRSVRGIRTGCAHRSATGDSGSATAGSPTWPGTVPRRCGRS